MQDASVPSVADAAVQVPEPEEPVNEQLQSILEQIFSDEGALIGRILAIIESIGHIDHLSSSDLMANEELALAAKVLKIKGQNILALDDERVLVVCDGVDCETIRINH